MSTVSEPNPSSNRTSAPTDEKLPPKHPAGIGGFLVRVATGRPWTTLFVVLILALASLNSAQQIQVRTSNLDLIDQREPIVVDFLEFAARFGTPNILVTIIEHQDPDTLKKIVDTLGPKLEKVPGVLRVLSRLPLDPARYVQRDSSTYLHSRDERMYFLFVQPENVRTNLEIIEPVVTAVEAEAKRVLADTPDVRLGFTGIPRYAIDDQQIIKRDISKLSWVSLLFVFAIFVIAFGAVYRPVVATAASMISVMLTFGFIRFYPGHLSVLSAPFAMIVFGQGVDYGIMLVNHVEELRLKGLSEREAIIQAVIDLQRTLITACATTVGGFLVLVASGFLGFQELGVISAVSLSLCLICMCTVLPAILTIRAGRMPKDRKQRQIGGFILGVYRYSFPPLLFLASMVLVFVPPPGFDSDYLNLQPKDSAAVYWERRMIHESDYSPYFAAFTVASVDAARALTTRLRSEETVGKIRSLADFITEDHEAPLPPEYRSMFAAKDGTYSVYAYPAKDIWKPEVEAAFLASMRAIDPKVTGMPFLGNEMIRKTKRALWITAALATVVLFTVITLDFRRPLLVAVVCSIPLLSVAWMHGLMRLVGISYNPLNIMALPIILGIAVDCGVHLTHRFLIEQGNVANTLTTSGRSVLLTGLTTFFAFGTLSLTSHSGLRSFALVLTFGVGSALLLSLTVLPLLLSKISRRLGMTTAT